MKVAKKQRLRSTNTNAALLKFKDQLKVECSPTNLFETQTQTLLSPSKNFVIGGGITAISKHLSQLQQCFQPKEIQIADNDLYLPQSGTLLFTAMKVQLIFFFETQIINSQLKKKTSRKMPPVWN